MAEKRIIIIIKLLIVISPVSNRGNFFPLRCQNNFLTKCVCVRVCACDRERENLRARGNILALSRGHRASPNFAVSCDAHISRF